MKYNNMQAKPHHLGTKLVLDIVYLASFKSYSQIDLE